MKKWRRYIDAVDSGPNTSIPAGAAGARSI
jgi:hypothetical protein